MRKKLVFMIICAVFLMTTQAFADTISQIGKKVAGETPIYLDGNPINNAIIVDNKSYAPVRDIAESLGIDLAFEKTKEGSVIKMDTPTPEIKELDYDELMYVSGLKAKIHVSNLEIEQANLRIDTLTKDLGSNPSDDHAAYLEKKISQAREEIITAQENLIKYTNELLELESAK